MEVPEELKHFNHMTDKEQQEHAEEITETIEKLMREGKLPYYGKRKWTKEKAEVNSVDNLTVRALSEEMAYMKGYADALAEANGTQETGTAKKEKWTPGESNSRHYVRHNTAAVKRHCWGNR